MKWFFFIRFLGFPHAASVSGLDLVWARGEPREAKFDRYHLFLQQGKPRKGDIPAEAPPNGIDLSMGMKAVDQAIWAGENADKLTEYRATLRSLKRLPPDEFENWVRKQLRAKRVVHRGSDMGIDGRLPDGRPLQIKRSAQVGRPVVDAFETAVRRAKRKRGMIVAFSFSAGAYGEADRAHRDALEIELKTVLEILAKERAAEARLALDRRS